MAETSSGRLVILTGPSCVGKSPLDKALARFFPELRSALRALVLYNSRAPRPGELDGVDYHFRTREQIESLREQNRYVVMDVRGDLQALDLEDLMSTLAESDVFFEGNPFVGRVLHTHARLSQVPKLGVFMSPLAGEEIAYLKQQHGISLSEVVCDIMRRKLLRRTRRQKGELSLKDLQNIERRASSAFQELKEAYSFQYVIPNHDGEDSENWDAFYHPLGDARRALLAFAALLRGETPSLAEHWDERLVA